MSPFDPRSVLFAKHAQHVVLIHFPIALLIAGVGFDLAAQWTRRPALAAAACYNLLVAAAATVPAVATGLLAWQLQLGGAKLRGVLLEHLVFAGGAAVLIVASWWVHHRARRRPGPAAPAAIAEAAAALPVLPAWRWPIEAAAVALVALAGHLGGFVSGVNLPQ